MDVDLCIGERYGNFIIRYARKEDCKNLLRLIKELADNLNSSDEAVIDVNTLEKYGFDTDAPLYKCLVIEACTPICLDNKTEDQNLIREAPKERNPLIAYALFSLSFSSWYGKGLYLEDIYVGQAYRGKGLGTALFKTIAKISLKSQCNNITLFVFKTNEMKEFFVSKGAENLTLNHGFDYYKFNKKSLINIANC